MGEYKKAFESSQNLLTIKDSIFSEESTKAISALETKNKIEEEARKNKELMNLKQTEVKHVNNLQYSGIFIFVVIIFISLFMVGKYNISFKIVNVMIFISFILMFEFVTVLLDPVQELYNSPVFKLFVNVVVALILSPVHNMFEEKIKRRMVKN